MSVFKAYNAIQNVGNSMIDNLEKGATNRLNKIGNSTDNTTEPLPTKIISPIHTETVTNGGKRMRTHRRKRLHRNKTKKHRKTKNQKKQKK